MRMDAREASPKPPLNEEVLEAGLKQLRTCENLERRPLPHGQTPKRDEIADEFDEMGLGFKFLVGFLALVVIALLSVVIYLDIFYEDHLNPADIARWDVEWLAPH